MGDWLVSWRDRFRRAYRSLAREKGSPEYIARGWALGVAIGCLLPIGSQLVAAVPLALLLRGSKIGAVCGGLYCNPLTVWFLYPFQCWLGNKVIGGHSSYNELDQTMAGFVHQGRLATLLDLGLDVILSFFAGGLLLALLLVPVSYWLVEMLVRRYRQGRTA